ncbi:carboxypeptidase-like regulatory domain-containing protein [Adhaeribacter swui]|uniref:Carboxypeptidase-like regulatory domain-containing protein n=1 Tax=Adhaeribacter swui TaxID=2086471 RepID=A0A7G7G7B9_9BACT|nr:TonB-dependent receptor [Adhaeribacter swui]QNF33053.1 carboxypeptidase-like regulatory domain-containing protein [Adhaeribacter swui]
MNGFKYRHLLVFACFYLFLALVTIPAFAQFKLTGTLTDEATQKPVVAANIVVQNTSKGAITNEQGNFSLLLPAGNYQITFSSVGYQPQTRQVQISQDTRLDVALLQDNKQMDELTITGKAADQNIKSIQMSKIQLDMLDIKKIPVALGESDIIKVLMLQPGVTTVGEGAGGFNVRGGRVDQNLILLEGAPLFNTSHLLGFFASVSPEAIQDVSLYKGGIPAQYGGRLSSLLTLKMRPGNPEKLMLSGGISPISTRLLLEGPILKNKLTFLVGGRIAYPNWIIRAFPGDTKKNKAFFYDFNGKLQYKVNDKNFTSLTLYRSFDNFKFPEDTLYSWQSNAASWQWNSLLSDKIAVTINAIHSEYGFNTEGLKADYGFKLSSAIQHQEIKADFSYTPNPRHKLDAGASVIQYQISPGEIKPASSESNINPQKLEKEFGVEQAAYLSEQWNLLPEVSVQMGLRYSWFNNKGAGQVNVYEENVPRSAETISDTLHFRKGQSIKTYGGWEPRLALRIGINDKTAIKLNYNRTRQYLHLISNTTAISPVDFWKVSDRYVPPQIADQVGIGFFKNLKNNTWETSIEGFYKDMQSLVEYKNGARLLLNPTIETDLLPGKGKAYGVELSVHKNTGRLTGQGSYTFSRSLVALQTPYAIEQVNNGHYFPATFDRPHNLALSGLYLLSKGWTLATNFVYTTGRPATYPDGKYILNEVPVVNYSRRNADRIPDYHRLDVSFTKDTRKTKNQEKYQLWVVSFYNLYARKNPYSIYFTNDRSLTKSYKLSVFGTIIPSLTWNFNF